VFESVSGGGSVRGGGRQRVLRIYYSSSVMAGAVARLVTVLLILKEAGVSRIARW